MNEHSYLLREGRWQISGSTIDVAGNPNVMVGYAIVTRGKDGWTIDEELNENTSCFTIAPLTDDRNATTFTGRDGISGEVHGTFAFFDDVILCAYHSEDSGYMASEVFVRKAEDCYEARGALFLNGGHVSSWSLTLTPAASE
ncbi:MAG TPA: hypothetical protein VGD79_02375 [Thermoanaerobaculia bacterium]